MSQNKRVPLKIIEDNREIKNNRTKNSKESPCELTDARTSIENVTEHHNEFQKEILYWDLSKISIQFKTIVFCNVFNCQLKTVNVNLYLANNHEITANMRAILIEWLADVSRSCEHTPDTFFMAVNYTDRFLAAKSVPLSQLQLVGITCLFISSKLNDIHVPQIEEFAYVTENLYSVSDIIEAEREILVTLNFNLIAPTVLFFAEFYFHYFKPIFDDNNDILLFIQSLSEYSLLDYAITNSYYPSTLGAAIILVVCSYHKILFEINNFSELGLDLLQISLCFRSLTQMISNVYNSKCRNATQRFLIFWSRILLNNS